MTTKQFALENMIKLIRKITFYQGEIEDNKISVAFASEIDNALLSEFSFIKEPWTVSVGKSWIGAPAIIITSKQFGNE